jgi:hypothetical protein
MLISLLLLADSPVAAQDATSNRRQPLGAGGQIATSPFTNTGVICEEEMTATFCKVPTGPNGGGYGSGSGSTSVTAGSGSGGGASVGSIQSIPPCGSEPPPNELCD